MNRYEKIQKGTALALAAVFALGLAGCRGRTPLHDSTMTFMPDNAKYMPESEIGKVIINTAAKRKWSCSHKSHNVLNCRLNNRGHKAVIDIKYSQKDYSIIHCGSTNLSETEKRIHPKFNKWVEKLEQDIFQAISKK